MEHKKQPIKIAVVGPESTGKSTVAEQLARQLGTVCVPECARDYWRDLNREYTWQGEMNMGYGQLAVEGSLVPLGPSNVLAGDTMFLTIKIWCDHLFGHTPDEVHDALRIAHYDLYLLMDIDLPWVDDPLRDFPKLRAHFMQVWHNELKAINANYTVVSGLGEKRHENAWEAVKRFLDKKQGR